METRGKSERNTHTHAQLSMQHHPQNRSQEEVTGRGRGGLHTLIHGLRERVLAFKVLGSRSREKGGEEEEEDGEDPEEEA